MKEQTLILDTISIDTSRQVLPRKPILTGNSDYWSAIQAELHLQPPHHTPQHNTSATVLCLHIGPPVTGEWWFDGEYTKKRVSYDQMTLYPSNIERSMRWHHEKSFLLLILNHEFMRKGLGNNGNDFLELVPQIGVSDPFVREIGRLFHQELVKCEDEDPLYIESLALALVAYLKQHYSHHRLQHRAEEKGLSVHKIRKLTDFIDAHLDQKIRLEDMASLLDMSVYYFSRLFKESTRLAPYQYVMRHRIQRSQVYLESHPELSIAEIALRCGFSNQSHFSTHFRKWVGTTPSLYRQEFI